MNSTARLRLHLASIMTHIAISQAQASSLRIQKLVARKLDPREESYEIPYDERDEYALRDELSRD